MARAKDYNFVKQQPAMLVDKLVFVEKEYKKKDGSTGTKWVAYINDVKGWDISITVSDPSKTYDLEDRRTKQTRRGFYGSAAVFKTRPKTNR